MPELVQRRWMERRTFRIGATGLHYEYRELFSRNAGVVPFEHIPDEVFEFSHSSGGWAVTTFVFALLSLATLVMVLAHQDVEAGAPLIWAGVAALTAFCWYRSRRSFVGLRCLEIVIYLHADKPTEETVRAFVNELQRSKHAHLLQHVGMIDAGTTKAQA